jgi:cyclopropane-fatty-acyl-phospholipid synthase
MKNTLQAVSNHKFANILKNIGNIDITHKLNFYFLKKIIKKIGGLKNNLTTQKKFLLKMGIKERAEIISKKQNFLQKADTYYRLKRLIDEKEMGNLFKFMLIKNKGNNFKVGF